ncbi:hypothetical protein PENSPDRAFT_757810 [Peniophora sp. CONT]|nr:hypothetical protein PENSPDRAFT_757810 [Peniophora sp. CONT]
MSSSTPRTETEKPCAILYGSPFDDAGANLAVRASDNVFFLVHGRTLLEMASPSIRERLVGLENGDDGHNSSVITGGRPVLSLSYPSSTVAQLLSTILPVSLILPETFRDTAPLLAAAKELGTSRCADLIRRTLFPKQLSLPNPIDAYFIACQHGLPEETRRAAEYSIGHRLHLEDMHASGDVIYRLYTF